MNAAVKCLFLILLAGLPTSVVGQEEPVRLERVRVSADQLKNLLRSSSLVPVQRETLEQRLRRAERSLLPDGTATIGRVQYRASLTEETTLSGTFQATIVSTVSSGPVLVSLGRTSFDTLQLEGLQWGNDIAGNHVAYVDRTANNAIQGSWSTTGVRRPWGIEFSFTGLDALASEIRLDLPLEADLLSDGTVLPPQTETERADGRREWQIIPLDEGGTQIKILSSREIPLATPQVERRVTWSVSRDTMSFRAEYLVRSGTALRSLSVPLPPNSTVESVAYGDNAKLPIQLSDQGGAKVVQVRLPEPLLGASRSLVISGRSQGVVDADWIVPALDIASCTTIQGTTVRPVIRGTTERVRVNAPLELQQIRLEGVRQTDSVFDTDGSHTISLARLTDKARATLRLGQAKRARRYRLVSRVSSEFGVWATRSILASEMPLPAELNLKMPADLTILSISAGKDRTPCEFAIAEEADGFLPVTVTLPPTENTFLNIRGYADTVVGVPLYRFDEGLSSSIAVVPTSNVNLIGSDASQLTPARLQEVLPASVSVTEFAGPGTTILELDPTRTLALSSTTDRAVPPVGAADQGETPRVSDSETTVEMDLVSVLATAPAVDVHSARITVAASDLFLFHLDARAYLVEVRVNGTTTRFERLGDIVRVPLDPAGRSNVLEARYEYPAPTSGLLTREHFIPCPTFSSPANVRWSLQLPSGVDLVESRPFGPARSTEASRLHCLLGPFDRTRAAESDHGPVPLPFAPAELYVTTMQSKLVPGYAWIGLVLAVLPALGLVRAGAGSWLCAIIGLLALLCFVIPLPFARICGGCLIGCAVPLALGDLVRPGGRKSPAPVVPPSVSAMTAGVLLVCLSWTATARAQPQPDDRFRVVELRGDDTVYVQPELLEHLDDLAKQSTPTWLFQTARYTIDAADDSFTVRARIDVLVPEDEAVTVWLPFASANCNRCTVNGQDTAFRRDGTQIHVPIPPATGSPQPPAGKTRRPANPRTVTLDLELHPPVQNNQAVVPLPSATLSTATVTGADTPRTLLNGISITPASVNAVRGQLSLSRTDDSAPEETQEPMFANECAIEVGPTEVTLLHRLTVTPGQRPLTNLHLTFPSSQRLSSLETTVASRQRVVRIAEQSFVAIDFEEPLGEPIQIRIRLTSNVAEPLRDCQLQLMPLVPGSTNDVASVSCRPGLEIQSLAVDGEALAAAEVAAAEPPQITVDQPRSLQMKVTTLPPAREAWLNQTVHVFADRLDYSLRAEVQILNGPVFEHTLTVDRNLQIDTVAVRENQVDRLARYQRRGNELLLLLDGRTSGVQEVIVQGRVSRVLNSLSSIPSVTVQGARVVESTLILRREDDLDVTLENANGIPFAVRPDGAQTDTLTTAGEATFRLLETTQLPLIRTQRRQPPLVDSLCLITPTATTSGQDLVWAFRLTSRSPGSTVELDLNGGSVLETVGCELTNAADEPPVLTILQPTATMSVRFNDVPSTEEIPAITWLSTVDENPRLLALPADDNLEVANAHSVGDVLPDWARLSQTGEFRVFEATGPWVLSRPDVEPASSDKETAVATFVETRVWLRRDERAGVTTIKADSAEEELHLVVPAEVRITSVERNQYQIGTPSLTTNRRLPIPLGGSGEVRIRWRTSSTGDRLDVPFPTRRSGDVFFVVHAPPDERIESTRTAIIEESEYITRRAAAGVSDSQPTIGGTTILALDINDTEARSPVFSVARSDTAGTNLGLGVLTACLAGIVCLALQTLGMSTRAAVLLIGLGLVLAGQGQVILGLLSGLTALVAFRLLPRQT